MADYLPVGTTMLRLLARALLCAAALGALAWWRGPDGRLHIAFLDTTGDAVLVQTPKGDYVLIDGGGDPAALATLLGRRIPFWRHRLGAVILSSPEKARLPGQVAALARYRAGVALAPPELPQGALANEWLRLLDEQRTPVKNARPGARLTVGGAAFRVLASGDAGTVLTVSYGRTNVVIDLMGSTAEMRPEALGPISALAYPWERPPPQGLLELRAPKAIIFTTGYKADKPALLTTYERAPDAAIYHPALNGTIELVSDGRKLWVLTERGTRNEER
jgi:hypothetical protein